MLGCVNGGQGVVRGAVRDLDELEFCRDWRD